MNTPFSARTQRFTEAGPRYGAAEGKKKKKRKNAGEGCAGIMTSGLNSPPESQLELTGGGNVSGLKFIKEQQDKGQRRLRVGGN